MVTHSISGPSCESLNVVVFAIRHSRQCKIRYHVEGHFLLINQSNDCCLSLSLLMGNCFRKSCDIPISSGSSDDTHLHINFQRVPKDGLAQLHLKKKKNSFSLFYSSSTHGLIHILKI